MKNKFFALILGMLVILTTMAATSCARALAQNDEFTEVVAGAPAGAGVVTVADDGLMQPPTNDVVLEEAPPIDLLSWPSIVSFVLLIISTVFGVYWKRASNVLNMIHAGLQEGSPGGKTLTAAEIKKIVAAWKGN